MRKRMIALYIGMAVLVSVFCFVPAYAQEDIVSLQDSAFVNSQYLPVHRQIL